jgi:hypothetical protein
MAADLAVVCDLLRGPLRQQLARHRAIQIDLHDNPLFLRSSYRRFQTEFQSKSREQVKKGFVAH